MLPSSLLAPPATLDELADVPVFPLPRIVFFPHTQLPLHFFEPRYRAMIEDCVREGSSLIAVVQLAPGWEADYEGTPEIRPIAGLGRIVAHEQRPDGTHDVLLQGLARVRLRELPLTERGYRHARAMIVHDENVDDVTHEDLMAVYACATSVASLIRQKHPSFDLGVTPEMGPSRLVDLVADRLVANPELRQQVLEAVDLPTRIGLVLDALGPLLARLTEQRGEEPS